MGLRFNIQMDLDPGQYASGSKSIDASNRRMISGFGKLETGLDQVGKRLKQLVTGAALVAGAKKSLNLFTDYQDGLFDVAKTANLTDAEMAVLDRRIDSLANDTLPVITDKLLETGAAAGQLGVKGVPNLTLFVETMAKMETASDLAGEGGAKALARLLNVSGEGIETIGTLGSVIVRLGNNFAASESEITHHAGEVARATSVYRLGSSVAAAFGATLAAFGVRAELSGSAVGRTFRTIEAAVKSGGDAMEALVEVSGRSAEEIRGAWERGPLEAFKLLLQGLRDIDAAGGNVPASLAKIGLKGEEVLKVLPVLATQYDELTRALKMAADERKHATALDEEFKRKAQTLGSELQLLANSALSTGRKFGEGMAPGVRAVSEELRGLDAREAAQEIGEVMGAALRVLASGLKLAADNVDLLKVAIASLIAYRASAWMLGVAASSRVAAVAMIDLRTAVWAVRSGYAALVAGEMLAKVSIVAGPVAGIAAALAALGATADQAIRRWREASERDISAIISDMDRARLATIDLRSEMDKGLVSQRTFEDAVDESARLGLEIQRVEQKIKDLERERNSVKSQGLGPDQEWVRLRKVNAEIEGQRDRLSNLQSALTAVDGWLKRFSKSEVELEKSAEDAGNAIEEQGTKAAQAAIHLREMLNRIESLAELKAKIAQDTADLAAALALPPEQLDLYESLNDVGVPGAKAMEIAMGKVSDAIDATLLRLARLQVEQMKLLEEAQRLSDEYDRMLRDSIEGGLPVAGSIQPEGALQPEYPILTPEDLPTLPGPGTPADDPFWTQILEEWGADYDKHVQERAEKTAETWARIGQIMADAVSAHNNRLGQTISSLVQMVALWQQMKQLQASGQWGGAQALISGAAVGSSVAGLGQQFGAWQGDRGQSQWGGQKSGDYGDVGALVGGIIGSAFGPVGTVVGAVLGGVIGGAIKKGADEGLGELQLVGGEVAAKITKDEGGLGAVIGKVMRSVESEILRLVDMIDGEILNMDRIQFKVRDDTISVFVNGIVGRFQEEADAINFAVTQALQTATIGGIDPGIAATLQNTAAETISQLEHELAIAIGDRDLRLGEVRAELRRKIDDFMDAFVESVRQGVVDATGESGYLQGLVRFLQDAYREFKGEPPDIAAQVRERARALKLETALAKANLLAIKAKLQAEAAAALGITGAAQAYATSAGAIAESSAAASTAQLVNAESMLANAQAAGEATQTHLAALAAIDEALAMLDELEISQADIAGAIARAQAAAGGGTTQSDREAVQAAMDQIARSLLPDLARQLAELDAKYADLIDRTHGDADAIARLNELRAEEERLAREAAVGTEYGALKDFEHSSTVRGEVFAPLDDLRQQAEERRDAMLALAESLGFSKERIERIMDRIATALEGHEDLLSRRTFVELAQGLVDRVDDEEIRQRLVTEMERVRFVLEMEQLRAQMALLIEMGRLTEAQVQLLDDAFEWLDANSGQLLESISAGARAAASSVVRFPVERARPSQDDPLADARRLLERYQQIADDAGLSQGERKLRQITEDFSEIFRVLGRGQETVSAFHGAMEDLLDPIRKGARQVQDRLLSDAQLSVLSGRERYERQLATFDELAAGVRSGSIEAMEKFPEFFERFSRLSQETWAGGGGYADIFGRGQEILDIIAGARPEDLLSLEEEGLDLHRQGYADLLAELRALGGADDERHEQSIRELRGVRSGLAELTERVGTNEAAISRLVSAIEGVA